MDMSRIIVMAVAVIAGGAAFFLVMTNQNAPVVTQVIEPRKLETTKVLVAARDLQRGERFGEKATEWKEWPKKAISPQFFPNSSPEKRDGLQNAVVRSSFVAGEPIVDTKVAYSGASGLMAALITPGYRAVTMRVTPESSSGGFVLPGDHVDILFTTGRGNRSVTKMLFEDVRVLAVNTMHNANPEVTAFEGSNVTIELLPDDAEAFTAARSTGALNLALRSVFKPEGEAAPTKRKADVNVIRYGRS